MSQLRQKIDEHKRRWREQIAKFQTHLKADAKRGVIADSLCSLHLYRRNPWESPAVCAAFEFAREENFEAVFEGLWTQIEVRGDFRCARTEVPEELVGKSAMMVD